MSAPRYSPPPEHASHPFFRLVKVPKVPYDPYERVEELEQEVARLRECIEEREAACRKMFGWFMMPFSEEVVDYWAKKWPWIHPERTDNARKQQGT